MDILFVVIGFLLMLVGIVGSILPVIPGNPISWAGLIMLYLAPSMEFDWIFISITGVIAITIYILDYIIPAIVTKKLGGSKAGAWGAFIGLFVGIIAPIPFGILLGPFAGALIGELVVNKTEGKLALKAAIGSFVGFLTSTFIKFSVTVIFLLIFIWKTMAYRDILF
ncbi:MAG: hypothetical protein ACI86C_000411 [Candidatus Latescibacterota bacterium]|jgi:uncharacterized protein YqgC (DUF456 family)